MRPAPCRPCRRRREAPSSRSTAFRPCLPARGAGADQSRDSPGVALTGPSQPRPMTTGFLLPQLVICAQETASRHFLEFDLHPDVAPADAIGSFRRLRAPDVAAGGVNVVLGFS